MITTAGYFAFGAYFFIAFFWGFRPRLKGNFIFPVYSAAGCMIWGVAMTLIGLTRLLNHWNLR